ncbi:MAG TPA: DUF86 domain-containing protein [Solirubrobacterales bacterium]|nr:DUF86 domain-containing protein [Solirubrobacterales bacterium]
MVDASRAEARVQRLEELIERLDEVRQAGEDAYLANDQRRAATERWLQVAVQICIDLGTQLVTEQSARPPSDYAEVFKILGEKGVIPSDLAIRLGDAAKQRNLIVHLYLEIDDRAVFASLTYLDDLREFAAAVERLANSGDATAGDPAA